jgi:Ala-tRNA(Pro) deacylase
MTNYYARHPDDLFAFLDRPASHRTVSHPPLFTVDGHGPARENPGGHTKNLFLKDKKGALFLGMPALRSAQIAPPAPRR